MSIRKKLILIGVCFVIMIVVFTVNVMKKMQVSEAEDILQETQIGNTITRAEAFRLLSYLNYNKEERETLATGITYADQEMSGWYDSYVNAVWKMGLIEGNITIDPHSALTYGDCKKLMDHLIIENPEYQAAYINLTFDFSAAEEDMPVRDFLELYEAVLAAVPTKELTIKDETLFVLGSEPTQIGTKRMVTETGKYYYLDSQSYEAYYETDEEGNIKVIANTSNEGLQITPAAGNINETDKNQSSLGQGDSQNSSEDITGTAQADVTDENLSEENLSKGNSSEGNSKGNSSEEDSTRETSLEERYLDRNIRVLTCGDEIVLVKAANTDKAVLHNVWIKQGKGTRVELFVNGLDKSFITQYKLSSDIEKVVGDITIADKKIVQISVKPDMIQGKVLRTGDNFIEIDGFGKVKLDSNFKIYKIYDDLSMEPTSSILVGYENTDFIVSGGKISAALITETIKAENIRVLIKTTDYAAIFHKDVIVTSDSDFKVIGKKSSKSYKAGDTVTIKSGNSMLKAGRITIKPSDENGKIQLLSVQRSYGNPKYRGTLEIAEDEKGLLVINELSLEEYLYAVIPSEMPTSYKEEALKVQAVCARSYAYKHLLSNSLSQYGAHVDDSVDFQVYNNLAENEDSILAVKDTYGKIIEYDGDVINALYFSTSCGHTADAASAWSDSKEIPYLEGKLLLVKDESDREVQSKAQTKYEDLSSEDKFRSFIKSQDITTYDSSFSWYRWKVTMNIKDMKKVIDSNLSARYQANPDLILTMTSEANEDNEAVFESIPVDTLGTIVDISVEKRESSGLVSEIIITGTKNTIKVKNEYNIRTLLAPNYDTITRLDESKVENQKLLPSAFFTIDKKEKNDKLNTITLTGGGYGHGVGLSQNGVKAMADAGKDYEDIVRYFYEGTDLGYIYE